MNRSAEGGGAGGVRRRLRPAVRMHETTRVRHRPGHFADSLDFTQAPSFPRLSSTYGFGSDKWRTWLSSGDTRRPMPGICLTT